MEIGKVVAFFENKRIILAVCLAAKENKYHCLSEENREVSLGANRISYAFPDSLPAGLPRETLVEKLKLRAAKQQEYVRKVAIQELWELVVGEAAGFTLRALAELVFSSPVSGDQEMALFRALAEDRIYFKQKGELFEARDLEKVEQIRLQIEREAEQEREIEEAGRWLAGVWAGTAEPPPESRPKIVDLLKGMAVFGMEAPNYLHGKTLLQKAGINTVEAPFDLLVRLGEWKEDENLVLLRHEIPQEFSPLVLGEAEEIISRVSQGILRHPADRDLTDLHVFTVDSEYTRDIDDALSLEQVGDQIWVGIHITDVATLLSGYGRIFKEAMARGTSIYLPDQRIPMVSPSLSEGVCSLIAGEKRRSVSFLVRLNEDGEIQEYQIVPSLIQVERRLSYDQVDRLLEGGDEELSVLHRIAQGLFRRRLGKGAFFIPRPERVIKVGREKEIAVYKRDRESPSQKMVSEFMILANSVAALFFKERGIPAIFRSQMEPREKIPPIDKFDPLQAYRLRRVMNRVEVSTRPLRHSGLAADAYLTMTSPIRRFYDLVMERQLLAVLRGETVLSAPQLEEMIMTVGPTLSKVGQVEELTERYWIQRFLEKRVGSTTTAVVLDRLPNRYLIHLNEYLLEVDMATGPGRDFVPGDQILVRLEKVNARIGVLKIGPV